MRATDVIDGYRDLHTRVTTNRFFQRMIAASSKLDMHWTDDLAVTLLSRDVVECFQVTKDMVPLVQMAAESLDESDQFRIDFAPAQEGFAQFERPIEIVDIRERVMHVSWVRWGVANQGEHGSVCWAMAFGDAAYPDEVNLELEGQVGPDELRDLGRWRYTGMTATTDGELLTLMDADTRAYARDVKDGLVEHDPSRERHHDEQLARILKALWLLMGQQVGEVTTQNLDRAGAKRARRLNLPTSVTVVELRRPKSLEVKKEESANVEWGYRWMVKGSFQWRACSEHHPLAEPYEKGHRARVWVSPYAKNADRDDLPWKMGEKVYVLKR